MNQHLLGAFRPQIIRINMVTNTNYKIFKKKPSLTWECRSTRPLVWTAAPMQAPAGTGSRSYRGCRGGCTKPEEGAGLDDVKNFYQNKRFKLAWQIMCGSLSWQLSTYPSIIYRKTRCIGTVSWMWTKLLDVLILYAFVTHKFSHSLFTQIS